MIDDDALVRGIFSRLFQSAGFAVKTFSSPEELFAEPVQGERRCIVADFWTPRSAASSPVEELANLNIPVIVVSAADDPEVREQAHAMGAVAFFRKPVDHQALLDEIEWVLSGGRKRKG